MFGVHLSETTPTNYRHRKVTDSGFYTRFTRSLIPQGIILEPDSREPWFLCEAHANIDFGRLEDIANTALATAL